MDAIAVLYSVRTRREEARRTDVELTDGSRIAVVGGGPAGSLTAYFMLLLAERVEMSLNVDLYEPKDFSRPGPRGCNMCGGIISESLVQLLSLEGLHLEEDVVQRGIDAYTLHTAEGSFHLQTPLKESRIAAVHRGSGPRGSSPGEWVSFDGYLLDCAAGLGTRIVQRQVTRAVRKGSGIQLYSSGGDYEDYDLVIGATGLNTRSGHLYEGLGFGYSPPRKVRALISEYTLGREEVVRCFGSSMHLYLLDLPGLEFAALIPKGSSVTLCLLGEDLDGEFVRFFLSREPVRRCFPPGADLEQPDCHCMPVMNVGAVSTPFADRFVLVGDSGVSRLYKDGIGAAYRLAKAAAVTSIFSGISSDSYRSHYLPLYRDIVSDNRFGSLLFSGVRLAQKWMPLQRALLAVMERERAGEKGKRRPMSRICWDLFTGSSSYRDILLRLVDPLLAVSFTRCLALHGWRSRARSEGTSHA